MTRRIATRASLSAAVAMTAALLTMTAAPAAHAVGENALCTKNWPNFSAEVSKNAWNYRTGPSTRYASKGYLYRGDDLKVLCSRGVWDYTQLTHRSTSGLPKGTRGWVRDDGLYHLAG
jgi:uncharacterized protein YgiM (DUF1202 family)